MLTLGKAYRLQKCASQEGKFIMLALDHRGNLRRSFDREAPESVSYAQIVTFKRQLTAALSSLATGVLLDPEYGAAPCIASMALAPHAGLLVALERTGYGGDPFARESQILEDWDVEKIARLGASGVKLLLYYHPDASNRFEQEGLVREVGEACRRHDIPFFLEPLSFSLDPAVKGLASAEKRQVVVETARRLTPMGVDVLKAEFPLNIADEQDEHIWMEACSELSATSVVPWVLLSAGVSFDDFERQTVVACRAGASGVLAGRAVWQEAVSMADGERSSFLQTTAAERMRRLRRAVLHHGRSWTDFHPDLAGSVAEGWYRRY